MACFSFLLCPSSPEKAGVARESRWKALRLPSNNPFSVLANF